MKLSKLKKAFSSRKLPLFDIPYFITVTVIALFGSLMVFSAGAPYAEFRYGDATFFIKRQIIWVVLGFITMIGASLIPPEFYKKSTPYLYGITLFMLVLVLLVGFVGNGAKRWISIGPLTIQPSEIAKLTIVLMLAYYFSEYNDRATASRGKDAFIYGTLIPCLIIAVPIILVMLQKHLSCIIILGAIGLLVIIASGINTKYIAYFTGAGAVGITCLALFTDYTKERITVWQDPEAYKLTGGWQTLQGLMAIGSGGPLGVGYGNSLMKYSYVSEPANDMIFAILCEELGFVGALLTLAAFAILVTRGYTLAMRAAGIFERLAIFGVTTKIAIQTLLNVAVVTNTIPNTGISLPFFSYGGSSLIMLFFEAGMTLSFSRYARIIK